MDFTLSEDQRAIEEAARAFAAAELAPHSARWDEEKHFPVDVLRQAAALGFAGIYVREDVGGSALSRLDAALIFEALALRRCLHRGVPLDPQHGLVDDRPVRRRRSAPQIPAAADDHGADRLLLPDRAGRRLRRRLPAHHAPGARATTMCSNGAKAFISGAGVSDIYVVMARTGGEGAGGVSTFVVEKDTPGLSFGAQERKMGWSSQPTAMVHFDDVRVPAANRVGDEGQGFRIAMMGLDGGRLNIAACSLGGAQLALETAKASSGDPQAVRPPAARIPGAAVQARRHGDRTGGGAADGAPRRRGAGRRRSGRHPPLRHGQALRHRRRLRRRQPGAAAARRLRLSEGLSRWSGSCATCASTRSWKAPTRSCG